MTDREAAAEVLINQIKPILAEADLDVAGSVICWLLANWLVNLDNDLRPSQLERLVTAALAAVTEDDDLRSRPQ